MSLAFHSQGTGVDDIYIRVGSHDIVLLQFILEGYEGLVNVTTIDSAEAVLRIAILTDFTDDVRNILHALAEEIDIKTVSAMEYAKMQTKEDSE